MTSRLTLICQGATLASRASAFPGNEPLEERTVATMRGLSPFKPRFARAFASPMLAARQTAGALAFECEEAIDLRDLDYGAWAGRTIVDIGRDEPERLARWLGDAGFDEHGGESIAALMARAGTWLGRQADTGGPVVAVTHAAVIRAMIVLVLQAPAQAFWRVDIAPLTATELSHDGRRWALRSCGLSLADR